MEISLLCAQIKVKFILLIVLVFLVIHSLQMHLIDFLCSRSCNSSRVKHFLRHQLNECKTTDNTKHSLCWCNFIAGLQLVVLTGCIPSAEKLNCT